MLKSSFDLVIENMSGVVYIAVQNVENVHVESKAFKTSITRAKSACACMLNLCA